VAEPLLRIEGLTKSFTLHAIGGRTVAGLRGVDLEVGAGEHVALAGASGAGKSTLLKCVYRTYLPTAGAVRFRPAEGEAVDLAALDERAMVAVRRRDLGYVSQFLRAEPRLGVLEAVARAGVRRGMDRAEAAGAAAEVLARLELDERLWRTYPTLLSGGEKQRVNLAAGIIRPPRLLLLDEPVSALDPASREAVASILAELPGRGVSLLSVFHDHDLIARLAHRVVVLDHGLVLTGGPPSRVLGGPVPA
jgi:alpha-D-ribose 1-methylphosphonate 5-triphosphate synthase subunit PhnL